MGGESFFGETEYEAAEKRSRGLQPAMWMGWESVWRGASGIRGS